MGSRDVDSVWGLNTSLWGWSSCKWVVTIPPGSVMLQCVHLYKMNPGYIIQASITFLTMVVFSDLPKYWIHSAPCIFMGNVFKLRCKGNEHNQAGSTRAQVMHVHSLSVICTVMVLTRVSQKKKIFNCTDKLLAPLGSSDEQVGCGDISSRLLPSISTTDVFSLVICHSASEESCLWR